MKIQSSRYYLKNIEKEQQKKPRENRREKLNAIEINEIENK